MNHIKISGRLVKQPNYRYEIIDLGVVDRDKHPSIFDFIACGEIPGRVKIESDHFGNRAWDVYKENSSAIWNDSDDHCTIIYKFSHMEVEIS